MPLGHEPPVYVGHPRGSTATLRRPSWMHNQGRPVSNTTDTTCSSAPPYAKRKVHFFSFASGPHLKAIKRITHEAEVTGAFDAVHAFTPEDIDRDYYQAHSNVLCRRSAGSGIGFGSRTFSGSSSRSCSAVTLSCTLT
jgi:hypothetical protein